MSKPKVILTMIVKNEEAVILRCLQSVYKHIDLWCIVDTGSSDRTPELITNFFNEKGIPGKLHHSGWIDFEYGRNESLRYAREQIKEGDYGFWLDADEELVVKSNFKWEFNCHSYLMTEYRGCTLAKTRFFRAFDFNWWYPVHEGLVYEGKGYPTADSLKYCHIDSHFDGARGKDPSRWARDASMIDAAVEVRERGELFRGKPLELSRLYFYSANSHFNAGNYEKAIEHYRKRIQIKSFDEEIFQSYYGIAKTKLKQGKEREEVIGAFMEAWFFRPIRYEPIACIIKYLMDRGEYEQATMFCDKMLKAKRPDDILFVEDNLYEEGKRLANILINPTPSDAVKLAVMHYLGKRWNEVIQTLDKIKLKQLTSSDDKFTYFDLYMIAYSWLGNTEKAKSYAEKILNMPVKHWEKHVPRIISNIKQLKFDLQIPHDVNRIYLQYIKEEDEKKKKTIEESKDTIEEKIIEPSTNKETSNEKKTICFYCNNSNSGNWDCDNINKGITEPEECVIYLSDCLAKMDYKVTIFCKTPVNYKFGGVDQNPRYLPLDEIDNHSFDIGISLKFSVLKTDKVKHLIQWNHELKSPDEFKRDMFDNSKSSVWVSNYQLNYGGDRKYFKSNVIPNGILVSHFNESTKRDPFKCIYASNYSRGLEFLLDNWKKMKEFNNRLSLDIYYGFNENDNSEKLRSKIDELAAYDVIEHGKVGHVELANAFHSSGFWLYPCNINESFCNTAIKAQCSGSIPVINSKGALDSNVYKGFKVEDNNDYIKEFQKAVSMVGKSELEQMRFECRKFAKQFDWNLIATKWDNLIKKL